MTGLTASTPGDKSVNRIIAPLAAATVLAAAQSPGPPLSDSRLSVSTLVREDIFAGFMDDDMERFARGEKNIEFLLKRRPAEKPVLLTWKAGATLYRAVRAFEENRTDEFRAHYQDALA